MLSTELTDLADRLSAKLREGAPARESIGDTVVAFGWSEGLPPIVARFVESARIDGLTFDYVRIGASATPATKVAEGVAKPAAVTLTSGTLTLPKYAGLAEFTLEKALSTTALLPALQATIVNQCLVAYDADAVAILATDAGETVTGATWTAAILNGIAAVASNGQNPSLLVLSPADYAAAVQDPGAAFSSDPANGLVALFGLTIAVVVGAPTGTGYVMDARAAVAVENAHSPMVLLDPYSKADTNTARLIAELVASFVVTQPAGVAKISLTVAGARGGGGAKRSDFALGA